MTRILFCLLLLVLLVPSLARGQAAGAPSSTPRAQDLPEKDSISQYGITWTFEKPARVGQFVTGDYYVVGPVTITGITPAPAKGRNGSCLNVTATQEKTGFDDRILFGRFDAKLFLAPPITLNPGDALLSSISVGEKEVGTLKPMLWRADKDQRSPIATVAVLTCLAAPVPGDAFRPGYGNRKQHVYRAGDLKRELLPRLSRAGIELKCYQGNRDQAFTLEDAATWFQRPWIDLVLDEFGAPRENMPIYGREFSRAVGMGSLLLCLDYTPEEKEKLLRGFVQVGIDLASLAAQGSQPTPWNALGGHGNGRKWPILFAGILLGDERLQHPEKTWDYLRFSEDTQTMFGPSWTGAKVVWAGHVGKEGHPRHPDWGAYEHLQPKEWKGDTGESYRRCCTSNAWVGQALAARLMHAEKLWNHDAFFAYVDRWMTEDDTEALKIIARDREKDFSQPWARQGGTWDPFVRDMWKKYRDEIPPGDPKAPRTPRATETWK